MATSNDLWTASRTARLSRARALTSDELNAIHEGLCRSRAVPGWPYGSATSINPLLVILGPSPGNSPRRGDHHFVTRGPFAHGWETPPWCVLPRYDGLLGQGEGTRADTPRPRWVTRRRCTCSPRDHEPLYRGERKRKRRSDRRLLCVLGARDHPRRAPPARVGAARTKEGDENCVSR